MSVHSILARMSQADIDESHGFPMGVVREALAPGYYRQLEKSFPTLEQVIGVRSLRSNRAYRMSAVDALNSDKVEPLWRAFIDHHTSMAFFEEFREVFGPAIARAHPGLADNFGKPLHCFLADRRLARSKGKGFTAHSPFKRLRPHADIMLDTQISFNSPVEAVSSVRGPHIDNSAKLFTALLYLREDGDEAGGNLRFYRRKPSTPVRADRNYREEDLEVCVEVPYEPNTLVVFVNSPRSIHGVTPRAVTERPRRYVNVIGECYGGRAPDYFTSKDVSGSYWLRRLRGWIHGVEG